MRAASDVRSDLDNRNDESRDCTENREGNLIGALNMKQFYVLAMQKETAD
mgnify:CR=1 FL=1